MNTRGKSQERDFITVAIPSSYDNDKNKRKNLSLWRRWKRLTSFEKLSVVFFTLLLIVGIVKFHKDFHFTYGDKTTDLNPKHQPHILPIKPVIYKPSATAVIGLPSIQTTQSEERPQTQNVGKAPDSKGIYEMGFIPDAGNGQKSKTSQPLHKDTAHKKEESKDSNDKGEKEVKQHKSTVKEINENRDAKQQTNKEIALVKVPLSFTHNSRQKAVVDAFKHAWNAYKTYAWGRDELRPLSKDYNTWFDIGLTLIDSLDTMWLMDLKKEFKEAKDWVKSSLRFNKDRYVNLFEVTIRVLGSLLSNYHLTGDKMFLEKAIELGDKLMPAFGTKTGVPFADVNLLTGHAKGPQWSSDSTTSEVSTIQLEFRELTRVSKDPKYKRAVDKVSKHIHRLQKHNGLVPIYINPDSGALQHSATITLGARGDSYYEYLLKQWLQGGKKEQWLVDDYNNAVSGIKEQLVKKSLPNHLTYIAELLGGTKFSPKMDHLVCFMAGNLALGHYHGLSKDHLDLGKELLETCYQMYDRMPTGLSPEIAYFSTQESKDDIIVKPLDAHNLLRPETVESLFIMYSITGDKKYQEYGWKIFEAFEKYTKIPSGGYSSIKNVKDDRNPGFRDKMESFFLGETLKYFFLLFSDYKTISLDKFVFNTEAHPLPIFNT